MIGTGNGRDRVAVLVDEVAEQEAAGTELSALVYSTASIMSVLESLGYEPVELSMKPGQQDEWLQQIIAGDYRLAFNLCETVGGASEGEHLAAAAVELLGLPKTGATAATLLFCLDKDLCSAVLRAHGISVPQWLYLEEGEPIPENWAIYPAIVKPAAEDASNGVHSTSVAHNRDSLALVVRGLQESWGAVVVQEFIEGREINLAIVGNYILPPSEIDFSTLPAGSPPIVTFEAKWVDGSPEDLGTR